MVAPFVAVRSANIMLGKRTLRCAIKYNVSHNYTVMRPREFYFQISTACVQDEDRDLDDAIRLSLAATAVKSEPVRRRLLLNALPDTDRRNSYMSRFVLV